METVAGFLKPSMELLTYYRSKIVGFEAERAEYLQRIAVIERHNGDLHKLRWELRSRDEEVEELQKTLGDAKVILFDEREQVLRLQAENDSLKNQEIEDRKRIQHLLVMTEPVTREVTFFRQAKPPTVTMLAHARSVATLNDAAALATQSRPVHTRGDPGAVATVGRGGFGVRRSRSPKGLQTGGALAPSVAENSPTMGSAAVAPTTSMLGGLSVVTLRKQLIDMRELEASRAEVYRADRASMREQYGRKSANDNVRIAQLEKQVADLQDKLTALTRDYLFQRHTFNLHERAAADTVAESQAVQMSAEAQAARVSEQSAIEVRVLRGAADQQSRALQHFVSNSERAREDDRQIATAQHTSQCDTMRDEISSYQAQLRKERAKYNALQQRRALEIEGFNTDIKQLRGAMRRVEKQWSLVHGVVADQQLRDEVRNLDHAYASIMARTAAAAAISDPGTAAQPPMLPVRSPLQQSQQHLSHSGVAAAVAAPNDDPVNATRSRGGDGGHWAGLVYPPKQVVEPAPGSYAVQDLGTRSRLRMKNALLQDNPVVYRVVRTSGYREGGTKGAVDGDRINERARSATGNSRSSWRNTSGGDNSRFDDVAQQQRIHTAALLSELMTEGDYTAMPSQQKLPISTSASRGHGAGSLYTSTANGSGDSVTGAALEDAPVAASPTAAPTIGAPRRVPHDLGSADEDATQSRSSFRSVRIASELQTLKQRVGTMSTLADRTAAVLAR